MSALLAPLKLLKVRKKSFPGFPSTTPREIRPISSVYLPVELWLWIRRFLAEKGLRALSSVCFTLRIIFLPHLPIRVYIHCEARSWYIKKRLSAIAKCPSSLRNISEIQVSMTIPKSLVEEGVPTPLNSRIKRIISAFLRNVERMPRLHTACFIDIEMEQEHLELLFQSNSLHHLLLRRCGFPHLGCLPPSRIRHLTLSLMVEWKDVEPLLRHCSANLEVLEIYNHFRPMQKSTTLPLFPNLRKLKVQDTSNHTTHVNALTSLAPRLKVLEVYGSAKVAELSALPGGLERLTINRLGIWDGCFGTRPIDRLSHLHITYYKFAKEDDRRGSILPITKDTFPNLTTLELTIGWDFRNIALLLARHLPEVTQLELNIDSHLFFRTREFDVNPYLSYFAEPRGPLARLYVNMLPTWEPMDSCQSWVTDTVLGTDPGLGGPYLQAVEVLSNNHWKASWETRTSLLSKQKDQEWVFWGDSHRLIYQRSCID